MMDEEKIDNDLRNHISGVFDNYEDTTADEGWQLLRQRYPEKEDRKVIGWLPWFAAAAVLLLAIGLWLIPNKQGAQDDEEKITVVKQSKQPKLEQPAVVTTPLDTDSGMSHKKALPQGQVTPAQPFNQYPGETYTSTSTAKSTKKTQHTSTLNQQPGVINPAIDSVSKNNVTDLPIAAVKPVTTVKENPHNPTVNGSVNNNVVTQTNPRAGTENQAVVSNKMDKLLNDSPRGDKITVGKKDKKVVLSVYTATYFNYANGSDNQLNVGAGFTSDFKLSSRLKLVTGVAIAQNSLNYNNDRPIGPGGNDQVYASAVVSSSPSAGFAFQNSVPVTTSYNASMVGLDVPLNLKYQFNPDKNDTFISAGLSSGTFINETYTTSYNYTTTSKQTVQKNSFGRFDVARTLNVSFGMGYPLGKSNRLIVEPFVKYPLGGLGEQNIRFGAGGVNLKLNFQSPKK